MEDVLLVLDSIEIAQNLRAQDPGLYDYVRKNCGIAAKENSKIENVFPEYTDHSAEHSLAVLRYGNELLAASPQISLNCLENAIFILACFFHDIGMNCTEEEKNEIIDSAEYKRISEYLSPRMIQWNKLTTDEQIIVDRFTFIEYKRRMHAKDSHRRILDMYPKEKEESYFGRKYLWQRVAEVCNAHGMNLAEVGSRCIPNDVIEATPVNLLFIACLLRLADYCDMGYARALPYLRENKEFYSEKSLEIWKSYQYIDSVSCDKETHSIRIIAELNQHNYHRAVQKMCEDIDNELRNQIKLLSKAHSSYHYDIYYVDDSGIIKTHDAQYKDIAAGFRINFAKTVELLMGSKLYRNKLFGLRECIQNALDAVVGYRKKYGAFEGKVCMQYASNAGEPYIDIYDNGTGMSAEMFKRHFLSIASDSFWQSESYVVDWCGGKNKSSDSFFIASHGIGVLSYFLIGKKIEIFSKFPESDSIHVMIDGYTTQVVFWNTVLDDFPSYNDNERLFPWVEQHGTCVRIHLKEEIPAKEMILFLTENILRPDAAVAIRYADYDPVHLPKCWRLPFEQTHFTNSGFAETSGETEDKSPDELISQYYNENKDFYDNPPEDPGFKVKIERPGIVAYVHITPYDYQTHESRVSQNGILVPDAGKQLDDAFEEKFMKEEKKAFSFLSDVNAIRPRILTADINLTGVCMLDLDAERTRFTDSINNREIIAHILSFIMEGIAQCISSIENCLYFPCGNRWYHPVTSLDTDDLCIAFHKTLNKIAKNIPTLEVEERGKLENAFAKAKLYPTLEKTGYSCISASAAIENPNTIVVIPKCADGDHEAKFGFTLDSRKTLDNIYCYIESVQGVAITLPLHINSFVYPLFSKSTLQRVYENEHFVCYKLADQPYENNLNGNIEMIRRDAVQAKEENEDEFTTSFGDSASSIEDFDVDNFADRFDDATDNEDNNPD